MDIFQIEDQISLFDLGWRLIANGGKLATTELSSVKEDTEIRARISTREDWVVREFSDSSFDDDSRIFFNLSEFFNMLQKENLKLSIIIWMQFCQTLNKLSDLTKKDWDELINSNQNRISTEFSFDFENTPFEFESSQFDLGSIDFDIKLCPLQRTSLKKLGKFPSVYEIILDFNKKTATNSFDGEQPVHSNMNIRKIAEESPLTLRAYLTLGKEITVSCYASNTGKEYKTYLKIIHCIFDKTGQTKKDYNAMTDKIGAQIEHMEQFWYRTIMDWDAEGVLKNYPNKIYPRNSWDIEL